MLSTILCVCVCAFSLYICPWIYTVRAWWREKNLIIKDKQPIRQDFKTLPHSAEEMQAEQRDLNGEAAAFREKKKVLSFFFFPAAKS